MKIIASILLVAFLVQDIAWADPGGFHKRKTRVNTLAPETKFRDNNFKSAAARFYEAVAARDSSAGSENLQIKDGNGLAKYIDELRGSTQLLAVLNNPKRYEGTFFKQLTQVFFEKILSDFDDADDFVRICRGMIASGGYSSFREAMNKEDSRLLGALRKIKKNSDTTPAEISFYGLTLYCLTSGPKPFLSVIYDKLMLGHPVDNISVARQDFSYHIRGDSVIHIFPKKIIFEGKKSYYRVRPKYMEMIPERDLSGDNHNKIAAAVKVWRAKNPENEERIIKFENLSTVIELEDMATFSIYSDPGRNSVLLAHIGRHRGVIYLSKKYLDSLKIESDEDMAELAFWLDCGQKFLDAYNNMIKGKFRFYDDKGNPLKAEKMDFADINNALFTISAGFTEMPSLIMSTKKIRDKLSEIMREDTMVYYKEVLDKIIGRASAIDESIKKGRELEGFIRAGKQEEYLKAFSGTERDGLAGKFGAHRNTCRYLLYRYAAMGLSEWADEAFRAMRYAAIAVQMYDPGGFKPVDFQRDLVFDALRFGRFDDFKEELRTLLDPRRFPRKLGHAEEEYLKKDVITRQIVAMPDGKHKINPHSFEAELDDALSGQLELINDMAERRQLRQAFDDILNGYFTPAPQDRSPDTVRQSSSGVTANRPAAEPDELKALFAKAEMEFPEELLPKILAYLAGKGPDGVRKFIDSSNARPPRGLKTVLRRMLKDAIPASSPVILLTPTQRENLGAFLSENYPEFLLIERITNVLAKLISGKFNDRKAYSGLWAYFLGNGLMSMSDAQDMSRSILYSFGKFFGISEMIRKYDLGWEGSSGSAASSEDVKSALEEDYSSKAREAALLEAMREKGISFVMIKPDGIAEKKHILELIGEKRIVYAAPARYLSDKEAEELYRDHAGKTYFKGLIEYITGGEPGGEVIPMLIRSDTADPIKDIRDNIVGPMTGLDKLGLPVLGTVRGELMTNRDREVKPVRNRIHGSDSFENALREALITIGLDKLEAEVAAAPEKIGSRVKGQGASKSINDEPGRESGAGLNETKMSESVYKDYFETVFEFNLNLFVLLAKRMKAKRSGNAVELEESGRKTKECIDGLQKEITGLENRLAGLPENGRMLESHKLAKAKFERAIQLIAKNNEPAANAALVGALNIVTAAREKLLKDRIMRTSGRVKVFKRDNRIVMERQMYVRTSDEAKTLFPEPRETAFDLRWQAGRSLDEQEDGNLDERDEMNDYIGRIGADASDIEYILSRIGGVQVEEKRLARIVLTASKELIELGDAGSVKYLLPIAKRYLELRITNIDRILDNLKTGRVEPFRDIVSVENADLAKRVSRIEGLLGDNNYKSALGNMYGLKRKLESLFEEPDMSGVDSMVEAAIYEVRGLQQAINPGKAKDLKTKTAFWIRIIGNKIGDSRLLAEFMEKFRTEYLERRSAANTAYLKEDTFADIFEQFIKSKQLIRGSPRTESFLILCYLAAFIPLEIKNPAKKSENIPNPVFEPINILRLMVEVNDIGRIIKIKRLNKLASTLDMLSALKTKRTIRGLNKGERTKLVRAIAHDYILSDKERFEVAKAFAINRESLRRDYPGTAGISSRESGAGNRNGDKSSLAESGLDLKKIPKQKIRALIKKINALKDKHLKKYRTAARAVEHILYLGRIPSWQKIADEFKVPVHSIRLAKIIIIKMFTDPDALSRELEEYTILSKSKKRIDYEAIKRAAQEAADQKKGAVKSIYSEGSIWRAEQRLAEIKEEVQGFVAHPPKSEDAARAEFFDISEKLSNLAADISSMVDSGERAVLICEEEVNRLDKILRIKMRSMLFKMPAIQELDEPGELSSADDADWEFELYDANAIIENIMMRAQAMRDRSAPDGSPVACLESIAKYCVFNAKVEFTAEDLIAAPLRKLRSKNGKEKDLAVPVVRRELIQLRRLGILVNKNKKAPNKFILRWEIRNLSPPDVYAVLSKLTSTMRSDYTELAHCNIPASTLNAARPRLNEIVENASLAYINSEIEILTRRVNAMRSSGNAVDTITLSRLSRLLGMRDLIASRDAFQPKAESVPGDSFPIAPESVSTETVPVPISDLSPAAPVKGAPSKNEPVELTRQTGQKLRAEIGDLIGLAKRHASALPAEPDEGSLSEGNRRRLEDVEAEIEKIVKKLHDLYDELEEAVQDASGNRRILLKALSNTLNHRLNNAIGVIRLCAGNSLGYDKLTADEVSSIKNNLQDMDNFIDGLCSLQDVRLTDSLFLLYVPRMKDEGDIFSKLMDSFTEEVKTAPPSADIAVITTTIVAAQAAAPAEGSYYARLDAGKRRNIDRVNKHNDAVIAEILAAFLSGTSEKDTIAALTKHFLDNYPDEGDDYAAAYIAARNIARRLTEPKAIAKTPDARSSEAGAAADFSDAGFVANLMNSPKARLDPREKAILRARYILAPGATPLQRILLANKFKVTKERVLQIEEHAIRKADYFYRYLNTPLDMNNLDREDVRKLTYFNPRVVKIFERLGIRSVADLLKKNESDFMKLEGAGPGTIFTIDAVLKENGLARIKAEYQNAPDDIERLPIDVLGLNGRTENALKRVGILTIGNLLQRSANDLRHRVKGLGDKGIEDIAAKLAVRGLSLRSVSITQTGERASGSGAEEVSSGDDSSEYPDVVGAVKAGWSPQEIEFNIGENVIRKGQTDEEIGKGLAQLAANEPGYSAICSAVANGAGGNMLTTFTANTLGAPVVAEPFMTPAQAGLTIVTGGASDTIDLMNKLFKNINVRSGAAVLLSENLFIENGDRVKLESEIKIALKSALDNGTIAILSPEEIRTRIKRNPSKDKLAVVLGREDYESVKIWESDAERELAKTSILILDDKLTGANYLYLQGVVGLARAIMANNRQAVSYYYKMLSGVDIGDDTLKLLDSEGWNNIAFAIRAILKFRDMGKMNSEEMEASRIKMETLLIAA